MAIGGYLKLFRKITSWEWYDEVYVKHVFLDLLIKANYKDKEWHGIAIKRGQFLTSRRQYAKDLHITEQKLRSILKKLESTNEIKIQTTHQYTLITIVNFDVYQSEQEKTTHEQPTNNPEINQQTTHNSTHETTQQLNATSIENKETKESEQEKTTHEVTHTKIENQPADNLENNPNIRNNNNIYNNKLNKNKLNDLFNYLNRKKKNFDGLTELDRDIIVRELKRLEIYAENITHLLTEKVLLQLQLQYWVITQIQLSPYKIYLPNLSRSTFLLKYLYTEKYINIDNDEEKINEFVSYLIVCLRKVFENM